MLLPCKYVYSAFHRNSKYTPESSHYKLTQYQTAEKRSRPFKNSESAGAQYHVLQQPTHKNGGPADVHRETARDRVSCRMKIPPHKPHSKEHQGQSGYKAGSNRCHGDRVRSARVHQLRLQSSV